MTVSTWSWQPNPVKRERRRFVGHAPLSHLFHAAWADAAPLESALAIDRFVFNTTTNAGEFDSTLSKGTLAVISGKMVKQSPDAMRVHTPSAIMGVRGTEFIVKVDR